MVGLETHFPQFLFLHIIESMFGDMCRAKNSNTFTSASRLSLPSIARLVFDLLLKTNPKNEDL